LGLLTEQLQAKGKQANAAPDAATQVK